METKITESVRVELDVLNRVRPYVKEKRMSLTGFISVELNKIMDKVDKRKNLTK